VTGHILALHLPAYDPDISSVMWFRDYAAYCAVATTSKGGLVAVCCRVRFPQGGGAEGYRTLADGEPAASCVCRGEVAAHAEARNV
jgi:hypothetical protein